jgi:hypothetical protein
MTVLTVLTANEDCKIFTFDTCTKDIDQKIQIIRNVNVEQCQGFCDSIYSDICQMFEYNKISQDCWISRQSFEDFRSTCYLIGGPKGTEMEKCRDCNKINGGSCLYFNEAIENFVDINETNRYNTKGQRPEDLRSMI